YPTKFSFIFSHFCRNQIQAYFACEQRAVFIDFSSLPLIFALRSVCKKWISQHSNVSKTCACLSMKLKLYRTIMHSIFVYYTFRKRLL
ncbi:hypothetical protein PFISCL1PPCAC_4313, partial [Pristionchus fissidentatus]